MKMKKEFLSNHLAYTLRLLIKITVTLLISEIMSIKISQYFKEMKSYVYLNMLFFKNLDLNKDVFSCSYESCCVGISQTPGYVHS